MEQQQSTARVEEDLIALARKAQQFAYAPYSGFRVGAALLSIDNRVFTGCNVENASFGLTSCAERNAVYTAVGQGVKHFQKLVIVTDQQEPTMPCGTCRQILWEFNSNIEVVAVGRAGKIQRATLKDLLPQAFQYNLERNKEDRD